LGRAYQQTRPHEKIVAVEGGAATYVHDICLPQNFEKQWIKRSKATPRHQIKLKEPLS